MEVTSPLARRLSRAETAVSEHTLLLQRTRTPTNPFDDIPDLTTRLAEDKDERIDGLRLVADSVAQQRQLASREMLFHPFIVTILVAAFGFSYQKFHHGSKSDWATVSIIFAGVMCICGISIQMLTAPYLDRAEKIGTWKWLDEGRSPQSDQNESPIKGKSDDIFITKFGSEIIGALIIRGVSDISSPLATTGEKPKPPSATAIKHAPVKGLIRGWTVRMKYRRKGVGTALLEDAVKLCRERNWSGPEFAPGHANSARPLPSAFNVAFERREKLARELLEKVKREVLGKRDSKTK